jgi:hypothetical protein
VTCVFECHVQNFGLAGESRDGHDHIVDGIPTSLSDEADEKQGIVFA